MINSYITINRGKMSEVFLKNLSDSLNSKCQFKEMKGNIKWTHDRIMNGCYCLEEFGIYVTCQTCKITLVKNMMKILEYRKICDPCKGHINGIYRDKMCGDGLSIKGYIRDGIKHCLICSNIIESLH
jgi:hypothetical protein